jgi:hypothetical protein
MLKFRDGFRTQAFRTKRPASGAAKRVVKPSLIRSALLCCIAVAATAHADGSLALSSAEGAATQPVQTGEIKLTFSERSPISTPKELARRLSMKPNEIPADYDISQLPFWAYIPATYDPKKPAGIIVYLGYKNTQETPKPWQPVLDRANLIFISAVCHSGTQYLPAVPLAEAVGLGLDAVYNLKRRYAIDERRIYEMAGNDGATQAAFGTCDIYTGFIVIFDPSYCHPMYMPDRSYYIPAWPGPPTELFTRAKLRPFFEADVPDNADSWKETKLKQSTMASEGFVHLKLVKLSPGDDLHYPNLKADWFEQQALPFLDSASARGAPSGNSMPAAASANAPASPASSATSSAASTAATTKPAAPSEAQHLLSLARLYIDNNHPELARPRLQMILDRYPNDPAAAQAKQLLDQLGNP